MINLRRSWRRLAVAALCALSLARVSAQVVPGKNVNMVSGREFPNGDPFLQRQDEPSIAVSSRNVLHLLAGANDYRTVDLPGQNGDKPTGDSWLGLFKSFDGGATWRSTLLPGYPQDGTAVGLASPLKGFDAAADPLVRAGANGLLFYSGIVFQRAAIIGAAPVGGGAGKNAGDKKSRAEQEREKERAREKARERERANKRARKTSKQSIDPKAPRSQPIEKITGGAEEDEAAGGESGAKSAIFVSTLLDLNNRENGDPISYIRTTLVDRDPGARFLDKQWMAVDVPRAGAQMCVIDAPQPDGSTERQSFLGGRIYVVYTAFSETPAGQRGQIMFSSSADCGTTWTRPKDISSTPNPDVNRDGVINVTDANILKLSIGKRCGDTGFNPLADVNGDCLVDIADATLVTRNVGKPVPATPRIPQGANVVINPLTGALNIAWREFKGPTSLPDAITFVQSSNGGASFSTPQIVSTFFPFDQATTETSFRSSAFPTITSDGLRTYMAWSARNYAKVNVAPTLDDARVVMTTSMNGVNWSPPQMVDHAPQRPGHQIMPSLAFGAGKLTLLYYDLRNDVSQLFGPFVDELPILTLEPPGLRHTLDVRVAQALPAETPEFTSIQLSEYPAGVTVDGGPLQQLQFNPPNVPIFKKGTAPFMGDYIDVAMAPTIRSNADGSWSFNIEPSSDAAGHAVWTDNRDVRPGPLGNFSTYTPPNSSSRKSTSTFDPSVVLAPCDPDFTGTRDQNIYTARFNSGLFASAVGNSKVLNATVPRAFAIQVQNDTRFVKSYRLTIADQPNGGQASFSQFSLLTLLYASIPPYSTIARTVYATSIDPTARINIDVVEVVDPDNPVDVDGGLRGTIVLNADPSAPRLDNTSEVFTPQISAGIASPRLDNPRLDNPRLDNPRLDNVSTANIGILNPRLDNPRLDNPRLDNSQIEAPRLDNPRLDNSALANATISDTTWEVTNGGNEPAAYAVKLLLNRAIPPGFETQLVIHKTYVTPTAVDCDLRLAQQNVLVVNITTPAFSSAADLTNPRLDNPRLDNATLLLAPGETANVTLRVFDLNKNDNVTFEPLSDVTPATVAQAVNTVDAQNGVTQPPVAIAVTITTPVLADVVPNGAPYNQQLTANVPGTWAIVAGTLPPGLALDSATGLISGVATASGSFSFTVQFTDTATPPNTATHDFVIESVGPLAVVAAVLPTFVNGAANSVALAATGGLAPLHWQLTAGSLPTGVLLDPTGVLIGSPSVDGTFAFTATVTDSAIPPHSASSQFALTVTPSIGNIAKVWTGAQDTNWSNAANWSPLGAPLASETALIPATTRQPTLTANVAITGLQIAGGATVDLQDLQLNASGLVDVSGTIVGSGLLRLSGVGALRGTISNAQIDVVATLTGRLTVAGNLNVAGLLSLSGNEAVVSGQLSTSPGSAILGGPGTIDGELNGFWAGTILNTVGQRIPVTFSLGQDGTVVTGTSTHLANVSVSGTASGSPVAGVQSYDLTVTDTSPGACSPAVLTGTGAYSTITGTFSGSVSGTGITCASENNSFLLEKSSPLTAAGVDVNGLTLENVVFEINRGAITRFDNVQFVNYAPTVLQFRIDHPGAPAPFTFDHLAFETTPTTGFDIQASDTLTDANVLTINLTNADAVDGPAHTQTLNGAIVNWLTTSADIAVTLDDSPDPAERGATITYTASITNNGPSNATNVQLVDTLPTNLVYNFAQSTHGTCGNTSGVVTCNIGVLAPGVTATVTIAVNSAADGNFVNAVVVTLIEPDPNALNNIATTATTVFTPLGPQTFTVTNTADSGAGSLRQAILDANANAGVDTIGFNIGGSGVRTIAPTTDLPAITDGVIIDATTQPGWSGQPLIELSGASASSTSNGLFVTGGGTTIRGFVINRFGRSPGASGGAGIVLQSSSNVVEQNYIGTDATGTTASPNNFDGVFISGSNNRLGGTAAAQRNTISGNGRNGVVIVGATSTNNQILNNYIGTNRTGTAAVPNSIDGVNLFGALSTAIGSSVIPTVISGNGRHGISVLAQANDTVIDATYVGTDASGTGAVGNGAGGIVIDNSLRTQVVGNVGVNVVAFNRSNGIGVNSGTGNRISGTRTFGNGGLGIDLASSPAVPATDVIDFEDQADSIPVGTPFPSSYHGMTWTNWLHYAPYPANAFQWHGANAVYAAADGASISFTPARRFVGGSFSRFTGGPGSIFFELYFQNALVATSGILNDTPPALTFLPSGYAGPVDKVVVRSLGNTIVAAGSSWLLDDLLFIDGPTANDAADADTGANDLQNFPVITNAVERLGSTTVNVTLESRPNTAYTVEFFASAACNPSGFGEGRQAVATATLAGNQSGIMTFSANFVAVAAGQYITATARENATGNTSEFSSCVQVAPSVTLTPNPLNLKTRSTGTMTVTLSTPAPAGGRVVTLASTDPTVVVPASVTVPQNSTSTTFSVTSGNVAVNPGITADAAGLVGDTAQVAISLRTMTLTAPSNLVGVGHPLNGTITLADQAPANATFTLTSDRPQFATVSPGSLTISTGATTGAFTISGVAAGSATISVSAPGYQTATYDVTATTSSLITLGSGVVVAPGNDGGIALSLGIPAPTGGVTVSLSSSNPEFATITPSVFIPQGLQIPAANPQIHGVAIGSTFITAVATNFAPDTQSVSVTVSLSFTPTTLAVNATRTANITLNLSSPAPAGGLTINTSIDNTNFATVPSTVQIAAGTTSVQVPVTGVAVGNTTLRASAPGIIERTAAITVNAAPAITLSDVTIGKDLETTVSGSLGAVAPAGGLQVTVTSLDPARVLLSTLSDTVGSSSITFTIGAGTSFIPSFYVQALVGSGTAQFQTSAPGYTTATNTVTLHPSGFILNVSNFSTTTRSADSSVRVDAARLNPTTLNYAQTQALRGGVTAQVGVTSGTTSVGTITNSPLVFTGGDNLLNATFHPLAAGTSTLGLVQPAGFTTPNNLQTVTATVTQPTISMSDLTIGKDLQTSTSGSLGAPAPAGNLQVTVTSLDTSKILLATSPTEVGTDHVTITVNAGSSFISSFYVFALVGTGTAQFQTSAPGYATVTNTVTLHPSGFILNVSNFSTTTLSPNSSLRVDAARLNPTTLNYAQTQALRGGVTAQVGVTSGTTSVGTITNSPLVFTGGDNLLNATFHPLAAGTSTLGLVQPAGFTTPNNLQTVTATVTQPTISMSDLTIGKDLQTSTSGSLGAPAPAGNLQVTVTSLDTSKILLATSPTEVGTDHVTITVNAGSSFISSFYVFALVGTGTAQFQTSAPGYATVTNTVTLHPSGFILNVSNFSTTTFSPNSSLRVDAARLNPTTLNYAASQALRGGITASVNVTSSDTNVGTIVTSPLVFNPGDFLLNTAFDPVTAGTTTITVVQPAGFTTPNNLQSLTATVTAPDISVGNVTVGRDLQTSLSIGLGATPPSPVTITVTSSSGALATITKDGSVEGGTTLTFTNVSSTAFNTIVVQGRSLGTTTLTVQAPGYNDAVSQVTIDPSGFVLNVSNFSTTTFSANTSIRVDAARLNPTTLNYSASQPLRGGLTVQVPVTSSNTTVGTIVTSPLVFHAGDTLLNAAFDPAASGSTTIAVTPPAGFATPSNLQQITVSVTAPDISAGNVTVGRDLQVTLQIGLGVAPPSPVTITVTSNNGALATITKDGAIEGGTTLTFTNVSSATFNTIIVQGRALGATTLTIQAPGYNTATSQITIDPSGFVLNMSNFSTTTFSTNSNVRVDAARLNPTTLNYAASQSLRGGLTVQVPVTSSDTTVGSIVTSPVVFHAGDLVLNTAFDPAAAGSTTIAVGPVAGFSTPSNLQQITATVTAPDISVGNVTVGRDLQQSLQINLGVAPPSPVTITVTSNNGTLATITKDGTIEGGTSLTFTNVTTAGANTFFVQGRALGTTTLTVQAPGYNNATSQVTIDPSGFVVITGNIATTAGAANTSVRIDAARLNATTLNYSTTQALRGGLTVDVPVTSSNTTVGSITTSPLVFHANESVLNTQFNPATAGTTTITVGVPAGFSTPSNFRQITATVNP